MDYEARERRGVTGLDEPAAATPGKIHDGPASEDVAPEPVIEFEAAVDER